MGLVSRHGPAGLGLRKRKGSCPPIWEVKEISDEKLHPHFNVCARVRGSTRCRPDGEGNVDSATYARRPARPSGSVDQQHSHTLAAPQAARRERILYGSGIGQYSKGATRASESRL